MKFITYRPFGITFQVESIQGRGTFADLAKAVEIDTANPERQPTALDDLAVEHGRSSDLWMEWVPGKSWRIQLRAGVRTETTGEAVLEAIDAELQKRGWRVVR